MNKYDYLFESFNQGAYKKKAFLLSIFSVIDESENIKLIKAPYALMKEEGKGFFINGQGEKIFIDDFDPTVALFDKNEPLTVKVDTPTWNMDVGETKTTIGRFLFNICVLYEAFNNKVKYIDDQTNGGKLRSIISDMMVDNPEVSGVDVPEDKASVDECLKVTKQLDYLEGLNHVFVKASSYDLFTIHPDIIKLRDELLAKLEAEGKLDDEIAVAEVIDILVAKDAEVQYNGPSKDLFIKHDFIANSRKKMFLLFDMVPDFNTGKYRLLKNSLQEGWDFNQMDAYANTAISASFDRGVGTARGGTEFKIGILLTNGIKVIEGDCKTTRTESLTINKLNSKGWVGGFYVDQGTLVEITDGNVKGVIGKAVNMRVPQYCKQPEGNLCSTCCGVKLGALKDRISSEVALIFTTYMLTSMKAMHVSKLNTVEVEVADMIR